MTDPKEAAIQRLAAEMRGKVVAAQDADPRVMPWELCARIAIEQGVIPIVQDLDARWIKMASPGNSWQPLDPKDFAWWAICSD